MKNNSNGLHRFFMESLQDIYYAEKHLVDALGTFQSEAANDSLRLALSMHRDVTKGHVFRLEEVFRLLGEPAEAKPCPAIRGILKEAREMIDESSIDSATRDAGLILAVQKAAHYQIATYGTLIAFAQTLQMEDTPTKLLYETLHEEKQADTVLTGIAKDFVNELALQEEEA